MRSGALRLRLDWVDAFTRDALALTPYTSITYHRSRIGSYTETGGGFPVQWDNRTEATTQARLGTDATYALNSKVRLLGRLEAVHRLDSGSSNASGNLLGLGNFEFGGINYKRDWLRAAIGAETNLGPGVVSFMLNGTTENNGPDYWAYTKYQINF